MDTLSNTVKTYTTPCFVAVLTQTFQILTMKFHTPLFPINPKTRAIRVIRDLHSGDIIPQILIQQPRTDNHSY